MGTGYQTALFSLQQAAQIVMNVFQIKVSQRTGNLARHHLLQLGTGVVIASLADQIQLVARMLNAGWDDVLGILDQPYHADHWRWVDG